MIGDKMYKNNIKQPILNGEHLIMNTATQTPPANERRARDRREIKQLIAERNRVLSQYYNLVNHAEAESDTPVDAMMDYLQEFCQELVDYLATGHFELYRRVEDGAERRDEMINISQSVFDQITLTTEVAIAFNDLYDAKEGKAMDALKDLPEQLSNLGQNLATRIDLEDRFINTLLVPGQARPTLQAV